MRLTPAHAAAAALAAGLMLYAVHADRPLTGSQVQTGISGGHMDGHTDSALQADKKERVDLTIDSRGNC